MYADEQVAKKCFSLKAKSYSLRCNSKTSLKKPKRSQRRLWGNVFNQSPGRRLRDLKISPLWDVSKTLYETSMYLRCIHAGWNTEKSQSNSFFLFQLFWMIQKKNNSFLNKILPKFPRAKLSTNFSTTKIT